MAMKQTARKRGTTGKWERPLRSTLMASLIKMSLRAPLRRLLLHGPGQSRTSPVTAADTRQKRARSLKSYVHSQGLAMTANHPPETPTTYRFRSKAGLSKRA